MRDESQAAAAARHAHEDSYRGLLDSVSDAIYIQNRDGTFLDVNTGAVNMYGYSRAELLGKTHEFISAAGKNDLERVRQLVERSFAGEAHQIEFWGQRANGEIFPQEVRLRPGTYFGQQVSIAMVQDITERKLAEAALRENLERFHLLLQDIPSIAVQGYGLDGTTQYWNRASEQLYGFSAQEAIGRNLLDLIIPAEMREGVAQAIQHMVATGQSIPAAELSLQRKDGSRVAVFSSHIIVQVPGRSPELFCIDLDLTDRNRAEAEREKLEGQLRQMQKMESVGRLAGGVAHDFNNKLQIILGYADMALKGLPTDHPAHSDLLEIKAAAEHSANLTKQLLAFSRRQAIAPVALNLKAAIAGSLQMLTRLMGEGIRLDFTASPKLGHVFIDPTQLDQILANLLVNAQDAISLTGQITIRAANVTLEAAECEGQADFVAPGEYVELTVQDNGMGMTPEIQAHIFEPFYTTKGQGKGTGLGLATVHGIVKQNHGAITVHSAPGQGAIFTIHLPRLAKTAPVAAAAEPQSPTGSETVLLVEDEEAVLKLAQRALTGYGYRVLPAATPAAALAQCQQHPATIHLILSDVVLPDMNGRELAARIQLMRPEIRVLFMSGFSSELMEAQDRLMPGVRLLQKPFTGPMLAQQVRAALDA